MIDEILLTLVRAGATPRSAAFAAAILDQGGSVAEAEAVIEVDLERRGEPLAAELLAGVARRAAEKRVDRV